MQHFLATIAFIFIFSSCRDNDENSMIVYKAAEEGLQQSIKNISRATDLTYQALKEKEKDINLKELTGIWELKAMEIKRYSDSMVKYIRELKDELKNEAGGNDPKNKDWENNLTTSEHVFKSHGRGKELFKKLIKYREAVLAVDPKVKATFEHPNNFVAGVVDFINTDTFAFTKPFYSNIPVVAAYVMLNKFENNVKIVENEIAKFCFNQIGYIDESSMFNKYSFLVSQSSTYLKAGDELEIYAGMGSLTDAIQQRIVINGKNVSLGADALATYKLKVPLKAGKYSVPVKVYFIAEDGRKESFTKKIEYTVKE